MRCFRAVILALPLASALAAGVLRDVSEESIRAALEQTLSPKYRDGVFEHGEHAIEALENEDPDLVSKVINVAKQDQAQKDLGKRQAPNATASVSDSSISVVSQTVVVTATVVPVTTTVTTDPSSPGTPVPTVVSMSTATVLVVPTVGQTTDSNGVTSTFTSQDVVSSLTTSVVVSVTTTNAAGSPVTTSRTMTAIILPTTNSKGSVVATVAPLTTPSTAMSSVTQITTTDKNGHSITLTNATPGATISATDGSGNIVVVTYTPGGVFSSVYVTTLSNGVRSTITTYALPSTSSSSTATSSSATATPMLPAGAAVRSHEGQYGAITGLCMAVLALVLA